MSRKIEESAKQIGAYAFRALRRAHAAGDRSLTIEDLKQELSIAWCIAVRDFDDSKGVPFGAFLQRGMQLYMNRYIEKNVTRRHDEVGALSLEYTGNDAFMSPYGSDTPTFGDIVPDGKPGPNVSVEEESQMLYARRKLSKRAYQFVKILRDQPAEIMAQVQHVDARCAFGKSRGTSAPNSFRLTSSMVFDLMDATPHERKLVIAEVRNLGDEICRSASK